MRLFEKISFTVKQLVNKVTSNLTNCCFVFEVQQQKRNHYAFKQILCCLVVQLHLLQLVVSLNCCLVVQYGNDDDDEYYE